ncbi:MAG TPA: hypothetical protein VN680_08175 [Burkholderiaceae bacterium]|jgi:hypothetical protein|nr:hypothetical protein [Burkholderiaceae bacterium]
MKYELVRRGARLEAIGAHSGYRIRMSTLAAEGFENYPVTVHIRGSESEDEVAVDVPHRELRCAREALDFGYDCAVCWIDALDHRG